MAQTPMVFSGDGLAINGYDPVAYFTQGRPVRGSRQYALVWKRAEWWFSSAANLAAFEANPRAFAPQFGGYCAYAVSQGYTAATDPEAWRIYRGKLYLTVNQNVRGAWAENIDNHIVQANSNWPGVLAH